MNGINLIPPKDVERMFARLGELRLDTSGIRRKFLNCPYGEAPRQTLDIYLPNEGGGPFPIIFFAHGGAWTGGEKDDVQVVPFIGGVTRGYAVVSLEYRLIPDVHYPENLFDIKSALRWIAKHAETYLLDPSRAALCGASAGAHLAMLAAFTQGQPAFGDAPGERTCHVRAVVEQFGPVDFNRIIPQYSQSGVPCDYPPGAPRTLDALLGVDSDLIPNLIRFCNPIDNIHPGVPAVLAQHGKRDPIIPYQQAVELCEKINAVAGAGMAELDLSEDFMHADPGYAAPKSVERIFGFLDRRLLVSGRS